MNILGILEMRDLKVEIHRLERRREELTNALEAYVRNGAQLSTQLLDELYGELDDDIPRRIRRAENRLSEIEGSIGRAEKIADAAFARNP